MPRRYNRTTVEALQRVDVPLADFPSGEGPPLFLTMSGDPWVRLGLGMGALVPFAEGGGGALVWGLVGSRAVVCIRGGSADSGAAYCFHAAHGPMNPLAFSAALWELECDVPERSELYVVIAAGGDVSPTDERFFVSHGVRPERIFTYSNALLHQFGVSAEGCVGEPR